MAQQLPDRVPVMCQLSIGHYFLNAGLSPIEVWFTSEGFVEALCRLQARYSFDGMLVNLPGRDPNYERWIERVDHQENETILHWKNGDWTVLPHDDNPRYCFKDTTRSVPAFRDIDPSQLFYVEPWDTTGITYPYRWRFEKEPRPVTDFFPEHHLDSILTLKQKVGKTVSIHSEIFSPWSQFLELLGYEQALLSILEDPGKVKACLERLTEGATELAKRQAACGVDAILISSAFAGGGLISRRHYEEFVLPFERKIIRNVQEVFPIPIYTHTCGSIGDRIDLMLQTGTNGIDALDPPPLGTVDLAEAKRVTHGKAFLKGNIDPVNTLLSANRETITEDVKYRLSIGKPGGAYILSTACSVSPHTPPEHVELLIALSQEYGLY
jgi:hypothetical protein